MKTLFFLVLIFGGLHVRGQSVRKCDCSILINPEVKTEVKLFDRPNGSTIGHYKNDLTKEDFVSIQLYKDSAEYFFVELSYTQELGKERKGWIMKSSIVGTYARNYAPKDTLFLYSKPDLKSNRQSFIPVWLNDIYPVSGCNGKWVYVKKAYKSRVVQGWLSPNRQCDNPYTTCN